LGELGWVCRRNYCQHHQRINFWPKKCKLKTSRGAQSLAPLTARTWARPATPVARKVMSPPSSCPRRCPQLNAGKGRQHHNQRERGSSKARLGRSAWRFIFRRGKTRTGHRASASACHPVPATKSPRSLCLNSHALCLNAQRINSWRVPVLALLPEWVCNREDRAPETSARSETIRGNFGRGTWLAGRVSGR
jgi:hypothetical protein